MIISFPESKAGEAVISAIAIASLNKNIKPKTLPELVNDLSCDNCKLQSWLDIGNHQYAGATTEFNSLPSNLYSADWLQFSQQKNKKQVSFNLTNAADVFVGIKLRMKMAELIIFYIEKDMLQMRMFLCQLMQII